MAAKDHIKTELEGLGRNGYEVYALIGADKKRTDYMRFSQKYQVWYTSALKIVATLAPDRVGEFRSYYEPDSKRKAVTETSYVIQDFIKGIGVNNNQSLEELFFDVDNILQLRLVSQILILKSLVSRIDSVLADVEGTIAAELQGAGLATAKQLKGISYRAAGALAGVVLEDHLQRVVRNRGVVLAKRNPTIADMNDPLKQAGVYDTATWRRVQYLADIRNKCSHRKETDPTENEISELIQGTEWVVKNVS